MCYYPIKILNKRFLPTRKNNYNPPVCTDERLRYITAECGHCFECRKKKRNMWRIRMLEQLRETSIATFFTGTISPQRYDYIKNRYNLEDDNDIITKEVRLFLERIRKNTGKSVKHWIVSEKGHNYTHRIHIHGIFFAQEGQTRWQLNKMLYDNWASQVKWYGYGCGTKCINYVSKYMTKRDEVNKEYNSIVLASPGLGKEYVKRTKQDHIFRGPKTNEIYKYRNGYETQLPRYYKEKFWTENQRQLLWIYKIESGIKYVGNQKIIVRNEEDENYYNILLKQHNEEGAAIHGDSIEKILILKMKNREKNYKNYRKKIREYYKIKNQTVASLNGEPPN